MTATRLILFALFATAAGTSGAAAQAKWCAWYDAYTYNCGFYTLEQCRATVSGAGGICSPDYSAGPVVRAPRETTGGPRAKQRRERESPPSRY